MLPQTTFRLWGLPKHTLSNVILVKQPIRHPNDTFFQNAITTMNKMILSHVDYKISESLNAESKIDLSNSSSIIDCNIINLIHHFPQITLPIRPNILDYSSIGHRSLLYSDLRFTKEFMRGAIRNIRFSRRFNPSNIIHWDDYAKNRKTQLINFGWKNEFLDTDRIAAVSGSFLIEYKHKFPELQELDIHARTLLIAPHLLESYEQMIENLQNQIRASAHFAEIFYDSKNVIVKRHRLSMENFPKSGMLFGKRIIVANSAITRLLPIEILILGMPDTFFYSAPSSSAFSFKHDTFLEKSNLEKNDFSEYGLMLHRRKISSRRQGH
jgi:hypothetical protein